MAEMEWLGSALEPAPLAGAHYYPSTGEDWLNWLPRYRAAQSSLLEREDARSLLKRFEASKEVTSELENPMLLGMPALAPREKWLPFTAGSILLRAREKYVNLLPLPEILVK